MSLRDRAEAAILPTYPERPLALVRGVGCTVWDEDGNAYLDLVGGLAVNSLGYGHPAAVQALAEQAAVLGHVSNLFYSEPMVALAERLCALSGQDRRVLLQLRAPRRSRRRSSWPAGSAGRAAVRPSTASCASRAPSTGARWQRSQPAGRRPSASRSSPCPPASSTSRATISPHSPPPSGRRPARCWWSRSRARAACGRSTPSGSGSRASCATATARCCSTTRCRRASAAAARGSAPSSRGVRPDAIALAKGLAGGLPIGALLATDQPDAGFERGDHATTFGGSPPIAAAALAVLDGDRARGPGRERPGASASTSRRARAPCRGVDHVRGAGLLLGIELARGARRGGRRGAARARHPRQRDHADRAAPRAAAVPVARRGRSLLCCVRGRPDGTSRPACHHGGIRPGCARIPVLESGRKRPSPAVFPPTAKGADANAHRLFRRRPGGPWTRRGRAYRGHFLG